MVSIFLVTVFLHTERRCQWDFPGLNQYDRTQVWSYEVRVSGLFLQKSGDTTLPSLQFSTLSVFTLTSRVSANIVFLAVYTLVIMKPLVRDTRLLNKSELPSVLELKHRESG